MVWLPDRPPDPAPLLVWFNHGNDIVAIFGDGPGLGVPSVPAPVLGSGGTFKVPAVVIAPLGGTTDGYFDWIGEQDVLDAIANINQRFDIDPNRVVVSGNSAGGYGTWRLGQAHPDLFPRWSRSCNRRSPNPLRSRHQREAPAPASPRDAVSFWLAGPATGFEHHPMAERIVEGRGASRGCPSRPAQSHYFESLGYRTASQFASDKAMMAALLIE